MAGGMPCEGKQVEIFLLFFLICFFFVKIKKLFSFFSLEKCGAKNWFTKDNDRI
jgi:uncharacterized iron-regulated protein